MTTDRHVLALETSTEACSIALQSGGQVFHRHALAPRQHAELALPWVEAVCAEAGISRKQITHLAVGAGPGAFTGVRLGVALVQGLAFAHALPVAAFSTLRIVATTAQAQEGQRIAVAMDARMQEVYWGEFEWRSGVPVALSEARVCPPEDVQVMTPGWLGFGTGFSAYAERFTQLDQTKLNIVDPNALPDARALLQLANVADREHAWHAAEAIEPIYLRNNVAQTIAEREAAKRDAS